MGSAMASNQSFVKSVIISLVCIGVIGLTYFAIDNRVQNSFSPILLNSFSQRIANAFWAKSEEDPNVTTHDTAFDNEDQAELKLSLSKAANSNKTVIITSLNGFWAENNSMLDLFLNSFHKGNGTEVLLNNLLIVAVDHKALNRCLEIHRHCYLMKTEGVDFSGEKVFMSQDYLNMMWRRLRFFGQVLESGYSFVFSDADIMWFRDPFTKFSQNADIQIASDYYKGEPHDLHNSPNGGFMYVRSSKKTISFFRYWYGRRKVYPGKNEQDVLNLIKFREIPRRGLKVRFLETKYFGGYCQRSPNLNWVYTMHANCCRGLKAKLIDLRNTLSDWEKYKKQKELGKGQEVQWTSAEACRHSWDR